MKPIGILKISTAPGIVHQMFPLKSTSYITTLKAKKKRKKLLYNYLGILWAAYLSPSGGTSPRLNKWRT
jgi:hypothetical protein